MLKFLFFIYVLPALIVSAAVFFKRYTSSRNADMDYVYQFADGCSVTLEGSDQKPLYAIAFFPFINLMLALAVISSIFEKKNG